MYFVSQLLVPNMQLSRAAFLFEDVVQEELSTSYLFVKDIRTIYLRVPYAHTPDFLLKAVQLSLLRTNIYNFHFLS